MAKQIGRVLAAPGVEGQISPISQNEARVRYYEKMRLHVPLKLNLCRAKGQIALPNDWAPKGIGFDKTF
jgi:hypothetical protein